MQFTLIPATAMVLSFIFFGCLFLSIGTFAVVLVTICFAAQATMPTALLSITSSVLAMVLFQLLTNSKVK